MKYDETFKSRYSSWLGNLFMKSVRAWKAMKETDTNWCSKNNISSLDIRAFLKPQKNLKNREAKKKTLKSKIPQETHHPTDEQLRHIDNSSNNNLLSVPSKLEWIFESEESPFEHAPALVTVFESRNF